MIRLVQIGSKSKEIKTGPLYVCYDNMYATDVKQLAKSTQVPSVEKGYCTGVSKTGEQMADRKEGGYPSPSRSKN